MGKCDNCHWHHDDSGDAPCEVFDGSGCDHWQAETNGDRIRRMSDIALAGLINDIAVKKDVIDDQYLPSCATDPETDPSECDSDDCKTCTCTILNWLRAPAEQEKA